MDRIQHLAESLTDHHGQVGRFHECDGSSELDQKYQYVLHPLLHTIGRIFVLDTANGDFDIHRIDNFD